MHFILTGAVNSGKSSFVQGLVERLQTDGLKLKGWITPAHIERGKKVGHDFVELAGLKKQAAIVFTRTEPFACSLAFRSYHFNGAAFERAKKIGPSAGLFVMDEIGPLELCDNAGFAAAARKALRRSEVTLTVVRKGLEEQLIQGLDIKECAIFTLSSAEELEGSLRRALSAK